MLCLDFLAPFWLVFGIVTQYPVITGLLAGWLACFAYYVNNNASFDVFTDAPLRSVPDYTVLYVTITIFFVTLRLEFENGSLFAMINLGRFGRYK